MNMLVKDGVSGEHGELVMPPADPLSGTGLEPASTVCPVTPTARVAPAMLNSATSMTALDGACGQTSQPAQNLADRDSSQGLEAASTLRFREILLIAEKARLWKQFHALSRRNARDGASGVISAFALYLAEEVPPREKGTASTETSVTSAARESGLNRNPVTTRLVPHGQPGECSPSAARLAAREAEPGLANALEV